MHIGGGVTLLVLAPDVASRPMRSAIGIGPTYKA
jgi:hypothetical protein